MPEVGDPAGSSKPLGHVFLSVVHSRILMRHGDTTIKTAVVKWASRISVVVWQESL